MFVETPPVTMLDCPPQIPHGVGCSDAVRDARAQSQSGNVEVLCAQNQAFSVHFKKVHGDCEDRGGTVVKVLRYKSEGRWFDSR